MFDIAALDGHPRVLSPLPYRVNRRGKVLVRKRAYGNGKKCPMWKGMIPERGCTSRAEMEGGDIAAVADMFVDVVFAADGHRVGGKTRLCRKNRTAAFLAIIAMTDRNAHWLAGANGG